jgi:protein serine kinase H
MGCGSSKKILADTSSDCIVKPILLPEGSRETRWSGHKNNVKRKLTEKGVRGAKFRARFDIRVTEKYAIKALIGKGAFSRVVRVEHKATKQPYAIKMMEVREGKEVFESELAVLRKVQHAYIVRLYEVFECKDKVYLVMELATGGELFDRIVSRGCFTEQDGTHVLYMVLEGVRYLHSLGITHRDLKPENLLYYHPGNDSKIMITDFGLSKLRKSPDDSTMDTTCGTPDYIAPEILMRRSYTNAVDMWSIGVISYVLLCGALPFADDNSTRLYRAIMKAKYSYKCEVCNSCCELARFACNSCLNVCLTYLRQIVKCLTGYFVTIKKTCLCMEA